MLKNYLDDNSTSYVNFLYYGIDLYTEFDSKVRSSIYREKYERLSKNLPNTQALGISAVLLLFRTITALLKEGGFKYLNERKISYVEKLLSEHELDRLIYNNTISISFVEIDVKDDSEWEQIKAQALALLEKFEDSIHDDSHKNCRILSLDIPVIEYQIKSHEPDIVNYNIDVLHSYLWIIDSCFNTYRLLEKDDVLKSNFTSELKYLVKTGKIVEDGLYGKLFQETLTKDFVGNNTKLKEFYKTLISFMSPENLSLMVSLQYRLFDLISSDPRIKDEDKTDINNFLINFIALDIFIYNKAIEFNDQQTYLGVFRLYNFYLIRLQDILDTLSKDTNKFVFVQLYKNQLLKSRNKLKDKINIKGGN